MESAEKRLQKNLQQDSNPSPNPPTSNSQLDEDEETAQQQAAKDLARMDVNQDGVVDKVEFRAAGGTDTEFDQFDVNHDGVWCG